MSQSASATETIARFVCETRLADLPSSVPSGAKIAVLDTIGVALAAADQPIGRIITEYVGSLGGEPASTVLGSGFKTSAPLAALANGTLAHGLDYDDRGHVSTHTLPAALAVGELLHASGERVLEAYILGREVGMRVTAAVEALRKQKGGPTFRGWYRVGVVGPLAAAVSASKLLGLDANGVSTALGIAATSAGGLRRNQGTMTKALHAGNAASDGVHAALLAQRGFSADRGILEAPLGYFNALCLPGELDESPVLNGLGKPFELEEQAEIKPIPACTPSHMPVQAILDLRARYNLRPDDVEAIEADMHGFSLFRADPQESIATGFSLPYLLSVAIVDGKVGLDQVSEGMLHNPTVRSLMARVRPSQASEDGKAELVTVVHRDGRRLQSEVEHVHNLTEMDEIEAKYRDCANRVLEADAVNRLLDAVLRLEQSPDIADVLALAGARRLVAA